LNASIISHTAADAASPDLGWDLASENVTVAPAHRPPFRRGEISMSNQRAVRGP
jgi:hypothetical protein